MQLKTFNASGNNGARLRRRYNKKWLIGDVPHYEDTRNLFDIMYPGWKFSAEGIAERVSAGASEHVINTPKETEPAVQASADASKLAIGNVTKRRKPTPKIYASCHTGIINKKKVFGAVFILILAFLLVHMPPEEKITTRVEEIVG